MPIGQILIEQGALSEADLAKALAVQQEIGGLIGQALHRIGAVTEDVLINALSAQLDLPVLRAEDAPNDRDAYAKAAARLGLKPSWLAARKVAVWLREDENGARNSELTVVALDPINPALHERIDRAIRNGARAEDGKNIDIVYCLADNQTIEICLSNYASNDDVDGSDDGTDESRLRELAEEAPVIDYVNNLFFGAMKRGASDIHIEAYEQQVKVRFRIDGVLSEFETIARGRFDAIASRLKLIAGMDIAERRLPQDGRCTVRFAGKDVDLRVSTVPSTWGESVVIRLLRKQTELPDLDGLGLSGRTRHVLERILQSPNGVFLVTGPTGSGKSTTLYRGLEIINDGERKIITIEDPVEYDIAGVTQIQVRSEIGYDFANGLRAILRQDPDVIMVGEIRDSETATIAAQAALTGHFVLSTLHTNSALDAVMRLRDIGLAPYLIAASVRGLMAQRLVRKLCPHCAERDPDAGLPAGPGAIDPQIVAQIQESGVARWSRPVGCDKCDGSGYAGRLALSEIVEVDDALRDAIASGAPTHALFEIVRAEGFETLYENGLRKAYSGITSLAEISRVCSGD